MQDEVDLKSHQRSVSNDLPSIEIHMDLPKSRTHYNESRNFIQAIATNPGQSLDMLVHLY